MILYCLKSGQYNIVVKYTYDKSKSLNVNISTSIVVMAGQIMPSQTQMECNPSHVLVGQETTCSFTTEDQFENMAVGASASNFKVRLVARCWLCRLCVHRLILRRWCLV